MIYFLYDSDGYYLGNSNIETENSTTIEPTLKDGYWSRFNGKKWTTEKIAESASDLDGVTIPDIAYDGVTASNHDKELYSLFERFLDENSEVIKDDKKHTLTFHVFTDEDLLKKAKIKKLEELSQVTALFENNLNKDMYFTSSLGFRVNGDRRTRSNIEDLIHFSPDFPVEYRDYDNQKRKVTQEQLQTMLVEHITNGENLYYQKWLLESKIQECTTIEEVNAIEIKFEMMDFSK